MKLATYLALVGSTSATILSSGDHEFIKFVAEHGRSYGTREEFEFRSEIFKQNLAFIEDHNSKNGEHAVGVNFLADMTEQEKSRLLGFKGNNKTASNAQSYAHLAVEDEINWVTKGAVTPVKNQGQCGSCWAFSTTGAIEGAEFVATGKLQSFSEQQLVDCSKKNAGCNGGLMDLAFEYVETDGIELESTYPYTGKDGTCTHDKSKSAGTVKSYVDVTPESPADLKGALHNGPVSVAIEADKLVFQFYRSGVLKSSNCGTNLDHGVLAAGFGTENGDDYFLVKNSWGPTWGDKGYVKISASSSNICGILSQPSQPKE